jgi:hypothetical protein
VLPPRFEPPLAVAPPELVPPFVEPPVAVPPLPSPASPGVSSFFAEFPAHDPMAKPTATTNQRTMSSIIP